MPSGHEDPFNLARFVTAQQPHFASVLRELKQGRKATHWMWFIFPQMRGLGTSWAANFYGISSRAEAEAYLRHPILGPRLIECTALVNQAEGSSAIGIFGDIDATKFRSSMTLFASVSHASPAFAEALDKYFEGQPDQRTLSLLNERE